MARKRPVKKKKQGFQMSFQNQALIGGIVLVIFALLVYFIMNPIEGVNTGASKDLAAANEPQQAVASEPEQLNPQFEPLPDLSFDSGPEMTIDPAATYLAKFTMAKGGEFTVQLYADKAPITVNSFIFLAKQGYYDGVSFHRVLPGFMAQGGDRSGSGAGGPGYEFVNEDSDLTFDRPGVVAMANAGRDTNGSQFFITFDAADFLNGGYTIFGQVTEGMDVVNGITLRDPQQNPQYGGDIIEKVEIIEQ